jgi:hypothetical protein
VKEASSTPAAWGAGSNATKSELLLEANLGVMKQTNAQLYGSVSYVSLIGFPPPYMKNGKMTLYIVGGKILQILT